MANANKAFRGTALLACILALAVVILGAYTRLSDAGLGCPDWPGCYGHLLGVPESVQEIAQANRTYPQRTLEIDKAWKEVIHRYVAGALGLLIILLAGLAWSNRKDSRQAVSLPILLVVLVIFQALLGMWTVTLLLKPVIVMLHLLGGLAILSLLWWLFLTSRANNSDREHHAHGATMQVLIVIGLVLLMVQIMLGGWTSANYAALACPDFPTCQGQWWPKTDFKEAFVFWRGLGTNYEFGVLDNPARTAIHLSHRLFAVLVAVYWLWLLARVLTNHTVTRAMRTVASVTLVLLLTQLMLGISNVILHVPIGIAVLHNAGAALLLLSVITLFYCTSANK